MPPLGQDVPELPAFLRPPPSLATTLALASSATLCGAARDVQQEKLGAEFKAFVTKFRVTIVTAATGAGKTRHIPRMALKEYAVDLNMPVLVNLPRKACVIEAARTVAADLSTNLGGSLVGYRVGGDKCLQPDTRLVFATAGETWEHVVRYGIGAYLRSFRVVLMDEVHENSTQNELLLGAIREGLIISGSLPADLRVILMSATAEVDRLKDYFGSVLGPNSVHHRHYEESELRAMVLGPPEAPCDRTRTELYYPDALEVVLGASRTDADRQAQGLPDQISWRKSCADRSGFREGGGLDPVTCEDGPEGLRDALHKLGKHLHNERRACVPDANWSLVHEVIGTLLLEHHLSEPIENRFAVFLSTIRECRTKRRELDRLSFQLSIRGHPGIEVVYLSRAIDTERCLQRLRGRSPGRRIIILCTPMAETGLTIENLTLVINSCRSQRVGWSREAGELCRPVTEYASASSNTQRAGRVGRTTAGTVYHLLPKKVMDARPAMGRPALHTEGLRMSVLQLVCCKDPELRDAKRFLTQRCINSTATFPDEGRNAHWDLSAVVDEALVFLLTEGLIELDAEYGPTTEDEARMDCMERSCCSSPTGSGVGDAPPLYSPTAIGRVVAGLPVDISVGLALLRGITKGLSRAGMLAASVGSPAPIALSFDGGSGGGTCGRGETATFRSVLKRFLGGRDISGWKDLFCKDLAPHRLEACVTAVLFFSSHHLGAVRAARLLEINNTNTDAATMPIEAFQSEDRAMDWCSAHGLCYTGVRDTITSADRLECEQWRAPPATREQLGITGGQRPNDECLMTPVRHECGLNAYSSVCHYCSSGGGGSITEERFSLEQIFSRSHASLDSMKALLQGRASGPGVPLLRVLSDGAAANTSNGGFQSLLEVIARPDERLLVIVLSERDLSFSTALAANAKFPGRICALTEAATESALPPTAQANLSLLLAHRKRKLKVLTGVQSPALHLLASPIITTTNGISSARPAGSEKDAPQPSLLPWPPAGRAFPADRRRVAIALWYPELPPLERASPAAVTEQAEHEGVHATPIEEAEPQALEEKRQQDHISALFASAALYLMRTGSWDTTERGGSSVYVTVTAEHFSRWNVQAAARDNFLALKRSWEFDPAALTGYTPTYHDGARPLS